MVEGTKFSFTAHVTEVSCYFTAIIISTVIIEVLITINFSLLCLFLFSTIWVAQIHVTLSLSLKHFLNGLHSYHISFSLSFLEFSQVEFFKNLNFLGFLGFLSVDDSISIFLNSFNFLSDIVAVLLIFTLSLFSLNHAFNALLFLLLFFEFSFNLSKFFLLRKSHFSLHKVLISDFFIKAFHGNFFCLLHLQEDIIRDLLPSYI